MTFSASGVGRAEVEAAASPRAEVAALKAQIRRMNLIMDSATEYAIITLDMAGGVTGWNAGASKITGFSADEALGHTGDIVFTEEDRIEGRFGLELCRAIENGRAVNERWHVRRDGSRFWASGLMMPLLDAEAQPEGFLNILRDHTEARIEAERRELLMDEMNHRIKNTFATIQAIAGQTSRHVATLEDFQSTFAGRLKVLSKSHDMLIRSDWIDAPLRTIIEDALETYRGEPDPFSLDGAAVMLAAPLVGVMSLVFYELATNSAKYGALSHPAGHVDVTWAVVPGRPGNCYVDIRWRERGGPPVSPPARRGFGSRLLEQGIPAGGTARVSYPLEGLECRMALPLGAD